MSAYVDGLRTALLVGAAVALAAAVASAWLLSGRTAGAEEPVPEVA